jgi:hypothetical protein
VKKVALASSKFPLERLARSGASAETFEAGNFSLILAVKPTMQRVSLMRAGGRLALPYSRALASRAALGPKAFAAEDAKAKRREGGGSGPSTLVKRVNSYLLAMGSLLAGGSFIHTMFQPDLRLPVDRVQQELEAKNAGSGGAAAADPSQPPVDASEGFVAASSFAGPRPGYVFKSGPAGLGYYMDRQQKRAP